VSPFSKLRVQNVVLNTGSMQEALDCEPVKQRPLSKRSHGPAGGVTRMLPLM